MMKLAVSLLITSTLIAASPSTPSQDTSARSSIVIRLLDSRSGKPVPFAKVVLWQDHHQRDDIPLETNSDGVARVPIHPGLESFLVSAINPEDTWNFVRCDWDKTKPEGTPYSTQQIQATGFVAPNHCSHRKAHAEPGELILFVRPATFFEKMAT